MTNRSNTRKAVARAYHDARRCGALDHAAYFAAVQVYLERHPGTVPVDAHREVPEIIADPDGRDPGVLHGYR